jgi:triosephosphate isomerase
MRKIYLNLKRFDIPKDLGGVNSLAEPEVWAKTIVEGVREGLSAFKKESPEDLEFGLYFPELHLYPALEAAGQDFPARLGPQGVYKQDVAKGGNFGAFTSHCTAKSVAALGATTTMVGHCEERNAKQENIRAFLALENDMEPAAILDDETERKIQHATNLLLNQEILRAQEAGLDVLYCLGEKDWELPRWEEVIEDQLRTGLAGADLTRVTIAYEPVWAIGPGKTPASEDDIRRIARFIKGLYPDLDVVYGGGLKTDNAPMLAGIEEISGGLIALTSFTDPIGFYPDQYLEIIRLYLANIKK